MYNYYSIIIAYIILFYKHILLLYFTNKKGLEFIKAFLLNVKQNYLISI